MDLKWLSGKTNIRCPVCGVDKNQKLIANTKVDWQENPVEIAQCHNCRAILLSAVQPPSTYTSSSWDIYIEHIAGIEAIAGILKKVDLPSGSRMLDVGCGYGFGLDIAQTLFGWKGIGLDPSVAAERGRSELKLDIRPGTLDDAFEPSETFDVIFASEVIEHVPDPRQFLISVEQRLSDQGIFVMSTPDGGAINPDTPLTVLFPALSIGAHTFLFAEEGLISLLKETGFAFTTWKEGATLFAFASRSEKALLNVNPEAEITLSELSNYCKTKAHKAPLGSALSVGMSSRYLKFSVSGTDYDWAAKAIPIIKKTLRKRYGINIKKPSATIEIDPPLSVLTVIYYFLGLFYLNYKDHPKLASAYFMAAALNGENSFKKYGEYRDPETPMLEFLSLAHQALALAQFDPVKVSAVIDQMEESLKRGAGTYDQAAYYRGLINEAVKRSSEKSQPQLITQRVYQKLNQSRVPLVSRTATTMRGWLK